MDYDNENNYIDSSDDDESNSRLELENELYSIVHYNALSEDTGKSFAGMYTVEGEGNELRVIKKVTADETAGGPNPPDVTDSRNISGTSKETNQNLGVGTPGKSFIRGGLSGNNGGFKKPEGSYRAKRFFDMLGGTVGPVTPNKKKKKKKKNKKIQIFNSTESPPKQNNIHPQEAIPVVVISDDEDVLIVKEKIQASTIEEDDVIINTSQPLIEVFDSDGSNDWKCPEIDWKKVESPSTWTKAMRKYYNGSAKRLVDTNCSTIIRKMRGSCDWWICDDDRYPNGRGGPRCQRCHGRGHKSWACPTLYRNCHMCSNPGHSENGCPERMCLSCGIQTSAYMTMCDMCLAGNDNVCSVCNRQGHWEDSCTDIWRRYHNTVEGNIDRSAVQSSHNAKQVRCCNCTFAGHLYEDCPYPYWSMHSVMASFVVNYGGEENITKDMRFYIPSNILDPHLGVLDELVTKNRLSGGQLKAFVGNKKGAKFVGAGGSLREISSLKRDLFVRNLWPSLSKKKRSMIGTGKDEHLWWKAAAESEPPSKKHKKGRKKKKRNLLSNIYHSSGIGVAAPKRIEQSGVDVRTLIGPEAVRGGGGGCTRCTRV
ncbi:hypothetical protein AAG570_003858 [Ranatra chinensis]|uniref:Zinc finger CCHC domain-containing protein 7 n=1 Tax=Ranatra chinensis TaxID=642074 RepID=A0ABD0Y238_9HEMI